MVLDLPIWWKGQHQAARIFPGDYITFICIGQNPDYAGASYTLGIPYVLVQAGPNKQYVNWSFIESSVNLVYYKYHHTYILMTF